MLLGTFTLNLLDPPWLPLPFHSSLKRRTKQALAPTTSPRKCRALLTRIVYLLYVGETFGTQEATTLFFRTTKLFQHKDVRPNSIFDLSCPTFCSRVPFVRLFILQSKSWLPRRKILSWSQVVLWKTYNPIPRSFTDRTLSKHFVESLM